MNDIDTEKIEQALNTAYYSAKNKEKVAMYLEAMEEFRELRAYLTAKSSDVGEWQTIEPKLHSLEIMDDGLQTRLRVHGGWIYTIYNFDEYGNKISGLMNSVFVPDLPPKETT